MGQPVRQVSVLACIPKEKKKEKEQHTDVAKLVFALRRLTDITHSTYVLLLKAELVVIDSDAVSLDVKPQ